MMRALFLLPVLALPSAAITVTTTADELDSPAGADVSLREAIRDTPTGGTVDFSPTLSGDTIELTMGRITINSKILTLDASALALGVTVSGGGNSNIIQTNSANLTLVGMRFTGGNNAFNGGAFEFFGTSVAVFNDCDIYGNESAQGGGAISGAFSVIALEDTRVFNNTTTGNGGAITLSGNSTSLTLTRSTVSGNSCTNNGGGIYGSGVNLVQLHESTVFGNCSGNSGGGVYVVNNTSLTLENSTVTGNEAAVRGGGLSANEDVTLESCTIAGNRAGSDAGGVFLTSTGVRTFSNTIIATNSAPSEPDLRIASGSVTSAGVNFIGSNEGSTADFPTGTPNGNGDLVGDSANPLDPLLSPLAAFGGAADTMHPLAGSPVIDTGGATTLTTDQRGQPRTTGAAPDIGAVETGPGMLVTTALDEDDGALGLGAGDSLRECLEAATGAGEHIRFAGPLDGATILLSSGQMDLVNKAVFVDASPLGQPVRIDASANSRHFDLNSESALALHSVDLVNGLASSGAGGAILSSTSSVSLIDLSISDCAASGTTSSRGGALNISGLFVTGRLVCVDTRFTSNAAHSTNTNQGGAIHAAITRVRCSGCTFTNNLLFGGATPSASGAAIYLDSGTLHLERCAFRVNQGSAFTLGRGGAISSAGVTHLERCTFESNSITRTEPTGGTWGGAIDISGFAPLSAVNCTFVGNTASQDGGGISVLGHLYLDHCTLTGNTATDGFGGGLRLSSGTVVLRNTLVAANTAGASAADIYKTGSVDALVDAGGNLIGDNDSVATEFPTSSLVGDTANPLDPQLGVLGSYGGPTKTIPPLPGSPARDQALPGSGSPGIDQRGLARPIGAGPDIGAHEAGHSLGYPVWAGENIPAGLDATFTGNSEGDTNGNGLEYACALNPAAVDGGGVVSQSLVDLGGGNYEVHFTFPYQPDAPDLFYLLRRNDDLQGGWNGRYRYNSSNGGELFHPSGNVTSIVDPGAGTITVIDAGVGAGPHHWRLEVELIP